MRKLQTFESYQDAEDLSNVLNEVDMETCPYFLGDGIVCIIKPLDGLEQEFDNDNDFFLAQDGKFYPRDEFQDSEEN